jgi:hypothetical protein
LSWACPSYGNDVADAPGYGEVKPRILLMGLKRHVVARPPAPPTPSSTQAETLGTRRCLDYRSGKSSIQQVVFHKMSPNETLFLETTNTVVKDGVCAPQTQRLPWPHLLG